MSKFLSGRLRRLLVGITGYTENNTVVQTTGKVGIGTTDAQQHSLYVVGSTNITGETIVGGGLTAVGIGSFQDDVYIDNELYVGGVNVTGGSSVHEDITTRNLKVTGISTVVGISTVESTLFAKELSVAGVSTFVGGIEIPDNSIARFGDVPGVLDTSVYHTGNTFYIENYSNSSNLSVNFDSSLSFGNGGGTGLYIFTDVGTLESYVEVQYTDPNTLGNADSGSFRVDGGAGIADNLTVGAGLSVTDGTFLSDVSISGISTFTGNIDANGDLDVDGHTNLDNVSVAGVTTFTGAIDANGDLDVDGTTELDILNVAETATFSSNIDANGDLDVDGTTELDVLNVAETATFSANIDANGDLDVDGHTELDQLRVSGLSTFQGDVRLPDQVKLKFGGGSGGSGTSGDLQIYHTGAASYINDQGTGALVIKGSDVILEQGGDIAVRAQNNAAELYNNGSLKFETIGIGVSISNGGTDTATIAGPENLILDPAAVGDNTGIVRIKGDLYVDGTEFKVDSSTINLADLKVGIATDVSTSLLLDGGGIGIGDPDVVGLEKTLLWNHANNRMEFNANLYAPNFYTGNIEASGDVDIDGHTELDGLRVSGVSTFQSDITVGSAITAYAATGIVSAIAFYGDGSNLTNTGATLSATSGVERLVTTQLTSGTMIDAATDGDLTFDAGNNTLNTENIKISGGISTNGTNYGSAGQLLRSASGGKWEWASVPGIFSVNNILNGFNVLEEGGTVGTAGSIHTLDFRGINVTASADPQPNGIATVTFSSTPTFDSVTVNDFIDLTSGISSIRGNGDLKISGGPWGNGSLRLQGLIGYDNIVCNAPYSTEIHFASNTSEGGKKLETLGYGVSVYGTTETQQLNVSGVSTFQNNVSIDGTGVLDFDNNLSLWWNNYSVIQNNTGRFDINQYAPNENLRLSAYKTSAFLGIQVEGSTGEAQLYHLGNKKLNTTGIGVSIYDNLNVGTAVTVYGNAGIVSATAFYGDGSNLSNTGATLSAAAGTQRLVLTSLTSGTMVDAATDGDLSFTAETNELAVPNLNVGTSAEISRLNVTGVSTFSNDVTFDGATTGRDITFDRSSNALHFEDWAKAIFGSGSDNLSIYHNGANSIISNDGSDSGSLYIRVTKDNERVHIQSDNGSGGLCDYFRANGVDGEAQLYHYGNLKLATQSTGIEVTGTTDTDQLNVSGVSTFQAKIEGAATNNVIPFLYANYSDLPNAGTYHGAFAHVHATGKAYFAHANAWYELVNKDLNGIVGTGTETYNVANINITGITTLGGPVTAGSSEGVAGQYLRHVGTGVTWANFPTLRTTQTFTALAGQTTFNFTYNVNFLDVYVNGVKLSPSEYTATNGSDVVLDIAAFAGDTVELYSYNTASTYGGGGGSSYTDANVNTHLNVSGASAGQILSWNGSDYAWVADQTGGGGGVGVNTSQFDVNNLHVSGISTFASGLKVPGGSGVSNRIELGNSQEFTLQYNTATTRGLISAVANPIEIQATTIKLLPNVGENGVIVNQNGSVELYHDNVHKFETTGYGVTVTGIASATSFSGDGSALTGLTGAAANTYGNATSVPQIAVDANGRITGITNVLISGGGGGGTSIIVQDSQSLVGAAGTIDFGTGLSVSPVSAGIVTVTADFDLTDLSVTTNSAGSAALSYNNSNGVFTYTPPDLSSYLTSYTETDPVVAAVNGIVKSNGSTISAATAGTDYLAPGDEYTSQWTFSASGASNYQVTGPGFAANSTDPTIYVMRGHKYKFTNNAGSHPLQIQYEFENANATAYTDGITNSNNVITWEVRNDTPDLLHYQCTSHDAMSGRIVVLGDVVTKGEWSASAGVAQTLDTITGVANNDIKTAEYTIHIENGSNMQAQKVLVMQDGTTAFSQEYGIMHKSGLLVSMSATISGGNLLLQATPETGVSGTTTYRITRQTMR